MRSPCPGEVYVWKVGWGADQRGTCVCVVLGDSKRFLTKVEILLFNGSLPGTTLEEKKFFFPHAGSGGQWIRIL